MTNLNIDSVEGLLIKAFRAGEAHAVGSHKDFVQIHPSCSEWVYTTIQKLVKEVA